MSYSILTSKINMGSGYIDKVLNKINYKRFIFTFLDAGDEKICLEES